MSNKAISVYATALKRQQTEERQASQNTTSELTREPTQKIETLREQAREKPRLQAREPSRDHQRGKSRDLPSREEIQEFTFRLRDELKVKVQAEVPHPWQKELEEIARGLDVKKLELYRFILGEFLGKVRRKNPA
jgi:hypothetical protein